MQRRIRYSVVMVMLVCMLIFALQGTGIASTVANAASDQATKATVSKEVKPNIVVLATGGTIAGTASSATQTSGYKAGALGIDILIDAVPQMKEIANITGEQVCKIASPSMNDEIWLKLAKRVNEVLAQPDVDGVVITHGTDTLEETAYFLNLVVKSDKPVILVGAMRPATAMSADGPMNIYNAVKVASDPQSKGMGVMICMNDTINSARDVTKTNTANVSTFKSPELGALGYIQNGKVYYYKAPLKKHTKDTEFDVSNLTELPRVEIVYSHVNDSRLFPDAAVKAGAKGIVHAGSGNGSIYPETLEGLRDAAKEGVVIVRSARVPNGVVTESIYGDEPFITSDNLNPQKARILLQLALTKTDDIKEIQRMFNTY